MAGVTSEHFYTITYEGIRYRTCIGAYHWKRVEQILGVPRSMIERGAESGLPLWQASDAYAKLVEERAERLRKDRTHRQGAGLNGG